jgi:hypothetical protein
MERVRIVAMCHRCACALPGYSPASFFASAINPAIKPTG